MNVDACAVLRFNYSRAHAHGRDENVRGKDIMTPIDSEPTTTLALPLLIEVDPLSPLEKMLAGVLGTSVAPLLPEELGAAKRKARDEDEKEEKDADETEEADAAEEEEEEDDAAEEEEDEEEEDELEDEEEDEDVDE